MKGEEIYQVLSKRDYSGSDTDIYAQLLSTLFFHLAVNNEISKFYDLLELANNENKSISIIDPNKSEYFYEDLILV